MRASASLRVLQKGSDGHLLPTQWLSTYLLLVEVPGASVQCLLTSTRRRRTRWTLGPGKYLEQLPTLTAMATS